VDAKRSAFEVASVLGAMLNFIDSAGSAGCSFSLLVSGWSFDSETKGETNASKSIHGVGTSLETPIIKRSTF